MKKNESQEDLEYYVSKLWEVNARSWIMLHDGGYNIGRDHFYTPKFLTLLPSIEGKIGLDVGCGDGYNTAQLLKKKPKKIIGIDVSPTMIEHATRYEDKDCKKLEFAVGNALRMPFDNESFEFATSFFSMQDIPSYEKVISEIYRVLKPGGFFQFSITHPCFWSHNIKWTKDHNGVECKNYYPNTKPMFGSWVLEALPNKSKESFTTYLFRKTFAEWINFALDARFTLERLEELAIPRTLARKYPSMKGYDKLPFYVVFRFRKPMSNN